MNNSAIPTAAACAAFFLAHANEQQGQATGNSNRCCIGAQFAPTPRRQFTQRLRSKPAQ